MTLARLHKFSLTFYLIVLGLTIPIYLLLYGASGHQFNIPDKEQLWLLFVGASFVLGTIYARTKEKDGFSYVALKLLLGTSLVGTFYGGIKVFLFMVHFRFGDDVGLLTLGLSYVVPFAFIVSCGVVFLGLLRKME